MRTIDKRIEKVARSFSDSELGCEVRYFESIDSTNALALAMPGVLVRHGLVLVARTQTAGRGRQGRSWLSAPDLGLHFTVLFMPGGSGGMVPLLSLAAAVSIHDSLEDSCEGLDIKWPNDVLVNGRKISGILGEVSSGEEGIRRVALGMSINLAHREKDFPPELRDIATSVRRESGRNPDAAELLGRILQQLNGWYDSLRGGDWEAVTTAVSTRSTFVSGRRIRAELTSDELLTGTTVGVNVDGTLQVRLDSGVEVALRAGDVHLL